LDQFPGMELQALLCYCHHGIALCLQEGFQINKTRVLDPGPKLLRFRMLDLATHQVNTK
jgi:hypothetical protein